MKPIGRPGTLLRPPLSLLLLSVLWLCGALTGAARQTDAPPLQQKPYALEGNEVKISASVRFAVGGDKLLPESDKALAALKSYLDDKTYISLLRIEGHTDADGDLDVNQTLSEKRALAVARWLVEKGVDCKRLLPVGFGSNKPVAPNDTPEGKAQNRRLAFVNAALRGRLIGGLPTDGGGKVAGGWSCHSMADATVTR